MLARRSLVSIFAASCLLLLTACNSPNSAAPESPASNEQASADASRNAAVDDSHATQEPEESAASQSATDTAPPAVESSGPDSGTEPQAAAGEVKNSTDSSLLQPEDLQYLGAFRLPEPSGGSNWEYSGYAMTYYPEGDVNSSEDGFPGSLFVVGHDHHQMVAEISIPVPKVATNGDLSTLNTASTLQPFADIRGGQFGELEIPRAGLEYLPAQEGQSSGKLYYSWGQHFQAEQAASHGWSELTLSSPRSAGPWFMAKYTNYVTNDYMFEIPEDWANQNTPGLRLATGRFRDGTWGGLGPALLAYGPWNEGNPPAPQAVLENIVPLLMYGTPIAGAAELEVDPSHAIEDFRESDEWSGGAWLTAGNQSAVVFVGTKGVGKCWYGFSNGVVYPTSGDESEPIPDVPEWPHDQRGWWSEQVEGYLLFYDPQELAQVAQGKLETWEPQPYATLSISRYLFDSGYDYGRGKMNLLGAAALDRQRGILYIVERQADEEKSVIHAFKLAT